jgi:hydrogenase/urease accessory protein HupE
MSKRVVSVVGVAAVLFGLVAGVAAAQSAKKIQFETSFAFVVNDKEMPAGRYELEAQSSQGPA